jgi:hypothetical protein
MPQSTEDDPRPKFLAECTALFRAFKNSPAIAQWVTTNEGWGEDSPAMSNRSVALFQGLDPHRLVDDASGGRGFGCAAGWIDPSTCPPNERCDSVFWTGGCTGDVTDHHNYPEPQVPYDLADVSNQNGKPFVQGEYGGSHVWAQGHIWMPEICGNMGTGAEGETRMRSARGQAAARAAAGANATAGLHRLHRTVAAAELPDEGVMADFERFNSIASTLLESGLGAQIYTQTSDIECENSGLLTYDRVTKVDFARIGRSNAGLLKNASKVGLHDASFL